MSENPVAACQVLTSELNRPAFEKHLDELGNEGFELCWVLLEQALQKEKDGHVLIVKRPKPSA